jgi:hypothetical protein
MLNNITWSEYIIAMLVLLFVFYLFVTLRYYRAELKQFLSGKGKHHPETGFDRGIQEDYPDDSSYEKLELLVNELRDAVLEKAGMGADRHMLLTQLKKRLSTYQGMQKPAYRIAINNYIIQHAKEICGVVFSEEELEAEWGIPPR